jgi:D-3-phosphoglycerate dehydrogenase / 2-oxoglutarate reductase
MPAVVITDYNFGEIAIEKRILEPLGCAVTGGQYKTPEDLIARAGDADYILTQFSRINADVIHAMRKVRLIVRYGVGVDNVDLEAAAGKGIPVCNVPDYCIDEVADHTLALILALTRYIPRLSNHVHGGKWKPPFPFETIFALKGMTVGLVAFGRIAREVAARLKPFKCGILVFDPGVEDSAIRAAGCTPVGLDELYARSDIVSLHCPSNVRTRGMINAGSIAKMKRGASLVNTSRGDLVNADDLASALRSGQITSAALDVASPEPINPDNPLLGMENVVFTPHVGSCSPASVPLVRELACRTIACAIRGEPLPNVVNGVPG